MNHEITFKFNIKRYITYTIIYILLYVLMVILYNKLFTLDEHIYSVPKENSIELAVSIILNNLKNLLMYIIFFPLMPLFWCIDFITTTWAIFVSIESVGISVTIFKLLPHGLIEVPNYTLYSSISFLMMRDFYKNLKKSMSVTYFCRYRRIIFINVILVIFAGLVEGLLT
ncbi:stage II sporulation protein M [Garciella nitratireducens]|uniref:stage II sporulation protein M n=1 Tax=Garciella nitratireducens TaxID=218205 RepID=UPI001BD58B09|nr:stage II sporulation protein M [Garciella nitratireducens]